MNDRTLTLLHDDPCACGCPTVSCPVCGGIRCLHCDPFCEPESSCHEPSEAPLPAPSGSTEDRSDG